MPAIRTIRLFQDDPAARLFGNEEYRTRLASALGLQEAAAAPGSIYSPLHGAAKLGSAALGAILEQGVRDEKGDQNTKLAADLVAAAAGTENVPATPGAGLLETGDGPAETNIPAPRVRVPDASAGQLVEGNTPFHDLIGRAEGTDKGRGYNETLAHGRLTGGPVNLTEMPVQEVMNLQRQMLNHPANEWNSSAAGRAQIVRKTLAGLVDRGVVDPQETFSPQVQNRAASYLATARGRNPAALRQEWEGLKNVSDAEILAAYDRSFGPGASPARAPISSGAVAAGDFEPYQVASTGSTVVPTTAAGRLNALTGGRSGGGEAPESVQQKLAQIDPRVLRAYQYGDDQTRALAGAVIQRSLAPPKTREVDLGDAIGIVDERGNVLSRIQKTRPLMQLEGGTVFDPNSREVVRKGERSPKIRSEEIGPEGNRRKILIDENTGKVVTEAQLGLTPTEENKPTNPYALQGKNTEEQQKNAGYASRMAEAHNLMIDLEDAGLSRTEQFKNKVPIFGNDLISSEKQRLNQSETNFLTAILRRESGASIAATEFETAERNYFPRPGDDAATLEQKRLARQTAIKGVMTGAGPNYKPPDIRDKPAEKRRLRFNKDKGDFD